MTVKPAQYNINPKAFDGIIAPYPHPMRIDEHI